MSVTYYINMLTLDISRNIEDAKRWLLNGVRVFAKKFDEYGNHLADWEFKL